MSEDLQRIDPEPAGTAARTGGQCMTADDWDAALDRAGIPDHLRSLMRFGSADDEAGVVVVVSNGFIRDQITERLRDVLPHLPDHNVRIRFEVGDGFQAPPLQGDDGPSDPPARPTSQPTAEAADAATFRAAALDLGDTGEPFGPSVHLVMLEDGRLRVRLMMDFATAEPIERGINPDTGEPFASYEQDLAPAYQALDRIATPGGRAAALAELIEGGADVPVSELHALQEIAAAKPAADVTVRTAGGLVRVPAIGSELLRRRWTSDTEIAAVEVDGEPLATRIPTAPIPTAAWVHHDGSPLFDSGMTGDDGQLRLPRIIEYKPGYPLLMVARRQLTPYDYRRALWADLRIAWVLLYSTTSGACRVDDWEGAALLARSKDGGFRRPSTSDVQRWRALWDFVDGVRLPYRDRHGLIDWLPLGRAEPVGDGSRIIAAPVWYQERPDRLKRYTLTNTAAPARWSMDLQSAAREVVFAAEYLITTTYNGEAAVMLSPDGGDRAGPWSEWYTWDRVLSELAGQTVDGTGDTRAARNRASRIVAALDAAKYETGAKHNGDVVEFELQTGKGSRGGRLRFRATPRFVEAARLAKSSTGWRSTSLRAWLGIG